MFIQVSKKQNMFSHKIAKVVNSLCSYALSFYRSYVVHVFLDLHKLYSILTGRFLVVIRILPRKKLISNFLK